MRQMSLSLCLIPFLLCFLINVSFSNGDTKIEEGLAKGDALLNILNSPPKLLSTPRALSELSLPFIRALAELRQQVYTSLDDAKKQTLMARLSFYNTRLQDVSHEYAQIRDAVDWSTVRLSYGEHERSILALYENLNQVLRAPSSTQDAQKLYFLKIFENDYNQASVKLYQGLVNDNGLFKDNLLKAVRKYLRNHLEHTTQFFSEIVKIIHMGIELEIAYVKLKESPGGSDYMEKYWEEKLQKLDDVIQQTKSEIASQWQQQADSDIHDFYHKYPQADFKLYSDKLYDFLSKKFYWRDWMVLAYSPVGTYNKHAHLDCPQTFIRFRHDGKNLIVSSIDKTNSTFSKSVADKFLKRLPSNIDLTQRTKPLHILDYMLDSLTPEEQDTVCQDNQIVYAGVIVDSAQFHLSADPKHFVHKVIQFKKLLVIKFTYNVFLFG